uniref:Uncharacterized protein n=1 Tax=candidate division CPR3 bacterium TaxID=2268181 RepID=A0A7C5UVV5_UNCC3
MDKNKDLLLKLIKAENEQEVENILNTDPYAKSLGWWPFNGVERNFGTINNQQTDPIAALVEKPINSIDSILIKECLLRGIDPKSEDAPKTMTEAVEKFFSIKDGDLSNIDEKKRRELSKSIRIIADGEKERPNIIIADHGEGQHPSDFKGTLLSLHEGNKDKILFVQGKYGMGGTGVIPFCGTKKYQLILSRKHPKLLKNGQKDLWGFSLIRKTPSTKLSERDRHSWFECLTDQDKEILSFKGEPLSILPDNEKMEYGCFIKLFNYDLEKASFVTTDLWRDLNRKLFAPALPILIQENRTKHFNITKGKNDTKILIGNKFRIKKDDNKFVRISFDITADLKDFGERKIEVVVFKDFDEEGKDLRKRNEWTTVGEAVFLTINGQTHFSLPRYWLEKIGLDFIKDYLFVHIDCTNVNRSVTDDIFLGSRDRVRDNTSFRAFQEALILALSSNELLQKLNEEYRERQLARIKPDKSIAKLVTKLVSNNKNLLAYFKPGQEVPLPEFGGTTEEIPEEFSGSYIPTFLKPRKKFSGPILIKEMPKNATFSVVVLETDAQNDYLTRKEDAGTLTWSSDNPRAKISNYYLYNGMLPLRISVSDPKEGEIFSFSVQLSRPRADPLKVDFQIKIVEEHEKSSSSESKPKHEGINLPELVVVRENPGENEENWQQHGWTQNDIAKVEPGRVYVNMDSADIKDYLLSHPKRLWVTAEGLYKIGIYFNAMILNSELSKIDLNEDKTPIFNAAISVVSKTLLPLYLDNKEIQALSEKES